MPFTKFTNLDFDQIKTSIKDYLRANSDFTDFDFDGSNFSVLIDTLAYNTYITAFNSNMIVNESFLDSATLRENVVSLARNIGYVPRSRTAAKAEVTFSVSTTSTSPTMTLQAGLVAVGSVNDSSYVFSVPENITTTITNGVATFGTTANPISLYQGTYLTKSFVVDGSLDQRFTLDNPIWSGIGNVIEGVTNVPLGRMAQKMLNVDNALDANHEWWERVALHLGWNTWDLGVKDPDIEAIKQELKKKKEQDKKRKKKKKQKTGGHPKKTIGGHPSSSKKRQREKVNN